MVKKEQEQSMKEQIRPSPQGSNDLERTVLFMGQYPWGEFEKRLREPMKEPTLGCTMKVVEIPA